MILNPNSVCISQVFRKPLFVIENSFMACRRFHGRRVKVVLIAVSPCPRKGLVNLLGAHSLYFTQHTFAYCTRYAHDGF